MRIPVSFRSHGTLIRHYLIIRPELEAFLALAPRSGILKQLEELQGLQLDDGILANEDALNGLKGVSGDGKLAIDTTPVQLGSIRLSNASAVTIN